MKQSLHGFSTLELLVVCAVMTAFAALLLPSYTRFKVRARQSKARTELTSLFMAQKSFNTEHGLYVSRWPALGFVPLGIDDHQPGYPALPGQRNYALCPGNGPNMKELLPQVSEPLQPGGFDERQGYAASKNLCPLPRACADVAENTEGLSKPETRTDGFLAIAIGCPRKPVFPQGLTPWKSVWDVWTMNENRELKNIAKPW